MSRGITEISTPKIRNFLKNKGAAMVGVAPIRSVLTDERYGHLIHDACPSADCVIVFGKTFPQSNLDACPENPRPARYTLHALYAEGDQICLLLSRLLESHGYRGVIIPAYLPVEMSYN